MTSFGSGQLISDTNGNPVLTMSQAEADLVDMVDHPPHYTRGPFIQLGDNPATTGRDTMIWTRPTVEYGRRVGITLECIDVIRGIRDGRLFNAMKYIWRVAFGGKNNDREDIRKAIWYLQDWLDNEVP